MTETVNPHFLVMQANHLPELKAREEVKRVLRLFGQHEPAKGWKSFELSWNEAPGQRISFAELVAEARRTGIVARIQRHLDRQDSVFGGMIDELATPNWQLKIKRGLAGFEKESAGPCRAGFSESDLTEDVLYCRAKSCEHSNEYDFRVTCRYFRAYLFACISVVDAFINRHILIASSQGFSTPEFEQLKVSTKSEDRVRLWFKVCSSEDPAQFFESREWCHFQELRALRNEVTHAVEPIGVYSIREIHTYLNMVRTGVGGLLSKMRSAHAMPTLGFIQQLQTAPLVDFNQITFRDDGHHAIRRIQGK